MRILVTGGAGFIGSHVVDTYVRSGHEVWVLDNLSRGNRDHVNPHARFVHMDLCSPDLGDLLADGKFDCVNHHAAQVDVRASIMDPVRDAAVNIGGTLNLLEAMRSASVPYAIFASTGGPVYSGQVRFPPSEQHPTIPLNPYGVAKRAIEYYLEYYHRVHALKYVVLRYAKVYGPRQDPDRDVGVVAIFCGKILRGQQLIIYGNGEQTRDFVYVEDVARANLLALNYLTRILKSVEPLESVESRHNNATQKLEDLNQSVESTQPIESVESRLNNSMTQCLNRLKQFSCVFNIGTGIETSVNALAALLLEAADADCLIAYRPSRSGEQFRCVMDPSLAQRVLGWKPLVSLTDGLPATLAWFRTNYREPAGGMLPPASCPLPAR